MAKRSSNNILLPEDILLYEILPRLPARSLGCCMCVCKQWRSFLTTPAFTKMHVNNINNQSKVLVVSSTKQMNCFYTMDCETLGLSANRPLPFGNNNAMMIISSLNGLVCVGTYPWEFYCGHYYLDIILWNPLTGDYKTMITTEDNDISPTRGYGLYYSSCDDDYKLLRVTQSSSNAYIYSWKSDTWRKAKSSRVIVDPLLKDWSHGCLVNEKLYFLAKRAIFRTDAMSSLIRFDTKTETFTEIATPTPPGECYSMTVVGGCIHLSMFPKTDSDRVELWKMSMDGEWMKVIRSCMSLYDNHSLHLMKNGNWLLWSIHSVNVFKKEGEDLKKACEHTIDSTMHIHYRGNFVETIVKM